MGGDEQMNEKKLEWVLGNIVEKLKNIYNHETNFKIECFWDGGFTVGLGDDMNGWDWKDTFETLEEALGQLFQFYLIKEGDEQ